MTRPVLLASEAKLSLGGELPWKWATMSMISLVSFTHTETFLQFGREHGNPGSLPPPAPVDALESRFYTMTLLKLAVCMCRNENMFN